MIGERRVSKPALLILAIFSYAIFRMLDISVEFNPWYQQKVEAARLMESAITLLRAEAEVRGVPVSPQADPNRTSLIGPETTPIVTDRGLLDAKLMTTNPNFAAVLVDMLKNCGVARGDVIAIAYTGSMPAANIAVLAAAEALGLKPVIVSSAGSSNWGATHPDFTWPDIEGHLYEKGIFRAKSLATSLGGVNDTAENLQPEGREILKNAAKRNGLPLIQESSVEESVRKRMALYDEAAAGRPVKAFINVGGGISSLGSHANGQFIKAGVNLNLDTSKFYSKGVLLQMAERGVPVIHLLKVRDIAREYDLPAYPVPLPRIGEGTVYYKERYHLKTTLALTFALFAFMVAIVELDLYIVPGLRERWASKKAGKKT